MVLNLKVIHLQLLGGKFTIQLMVFQQFFMSSHPGNLALFHKNNLLSIYNSSQTVRNYNRSPALHQIGQCFLYYGL